MARQRVLKRAGWTFWRYFPSSWARRKDEVVKDLLKTLEDLGIEPLGSEVVDNAVWVYWKEVDPFRRRGVRKVIAKPQPLYARYWVSMDINSMLAELRAERERLTEAILVLERLAAGGHKRRGRPPKWLATAASSVQEGGRTRKRRPFRAATRAKMAQAQKKRWAARRKEAA